MKKKKQRKPRQSQPKSKLSVLRQVCDLIPSHLVEKLARKHGVDKKARKITPWSHVVSMVFAQISGAISLNDVCDNLRNHGGLLATIRGALAPSRNGLSHANKVRSCAMAEELFWSTLTHLEEQTPAFGRRGPKKRKRGIPRRFKRIIHAVDSSTIKLVANCMGWAKHRRRKAAAKLHLRLNVGSFLPGFAVVEAANHNDNFRAKELCAGILEGEIVVFDKAYVDFNHLFGLAERGVFWVTRAKDNMVCRVVKRRIKKRQGKILRDDIIVLKNKKSRAAYPQTLRRVVAIVEVDGKECEMTFITNNTEWAAGSVCDLYQSRWEIEVFFKQIKQNLKLCDFLGNNANAVGWQVWTALLVYVLLRYLGHVSDWSHSFSRLYTMVRGSLWDKMALLEILKKYGTAGGSFRMLGRPDQAYLPGLSVAAMG
jgi:hypothetical protein